MLRLYTFIVLIICAVLFISGCGPERFGLGRDAAPTATPTVASVPTYTPSPMPPPTEVAPTEIASTEVISTEPAPPEVALLPTMTVPAGADTQVITTSESVSESVSASVVGLLPTVTPATPLTTPQVETTPPTAIPDEPQVRVSVESANIRNGPSTDYLQIGVVSQGEAYPLTGRNAAGDWWQVCCFEEQPGWIFGPLVEAHMGETVAEITQLPPLPIPPTAEPIAEAVPNGETLTEEVPAVEESPPASESGEPEPTEPEPAAPAEQSGTAGNFDPNAQYQIVHYRILGFDDNNGGIFNKGGQHLIFVTVLDQNGNGVDGAVVKDAVDDKLNVVTGSKGPGKAEITMDWDRYKLYVATDPSGAVTSQVSNQMNTAYPHIPDIVGMLGPTDNEYAICPTIDDRCSPPFYHAHWSYEITFQRVK